MEHFGWRDGVIGGWSENSGARLLLTSVGWGGRVRNIESRHLSAP